MADTGTSPLAGRRAPIMDPVARFWADVNRDGPIPSYRPSLGNCWVWTGKVNNKGYPLLRLRGKDIPAYRFSYELLVKPIPQGLEIDHLCRVPKCVRPDHLEPVTHAENQRRLSEALTHCRRAGHKYTEENTLRGGDGHRMCRQCDTDRQRAARADRRAERERLGIPPRSSRPKNPARGESHGNSKLTDQQVIEIRARAGAGVEQKSIAKVYGVNPATISRIVRGKSRAA